MKHGDEKARVVLEDHAYGREGRSGAISIISLMPGKLLAGTDAGQREISF
jgi:hypothetical protein